MKKLLPKPTSKRVILLAALATLVAMIVLWIFTESNNWRADTVRNENVAYCDTSDRQQTLDFYRPEDSGNRTLPLLVYIHGGGWRWGSKNNSMFNNYAPLLLKHSVAVASVNYRLNPPRPYPDQNNDVACAISYLTNHASELHIDGTKMILMGESAGSELAMFAALNSAASPYTYPLPIGVIDFYGVTDFTKIVNGQHPDLNARRYLGTTYSQIAQQASPLTYIRPQEPRFLIIHGQHDNVVPPEQSEALQKALTAASVQSTYVKIPNASHAFVGPELTPTSYKMILDSLDAFLKQTIDR